MGGQEDEKTKYSVVESLPCAYAACLYGRRMQTLEAANALHHDDDFYPCNNNDPGNNDSPGNHDDTDHDNDDDCCGGGDSRMVEIRSC